MNRNKLKREGKKWVEEGIISNDQLERIVARYRNKDVNIIVILFAVLLTGLGLITFILSDWARQPHFSRILIFIVAMLVLYILGDVLYRKQSSLIGASFLVLGFIVFGTGTFLTIDIYQIELYSAWPFVIFTLIGLALYFIYQHRLLFVVSIIVVTIGQIYSGIAFSEWNWLLMILFVFGCSHFVYHHKNHLYSYLFSISFSIQALTWVIAESQQYYWLILCFFFLYIIGDALKEQVFHLPMKYVALLSIFLFSMYQTFLLQEDYFMKDMEFQIGFMIAWIIFFFIASMMKVKSERKWEMIDFLLFLPIVFLPFAYLIGLVLLFVFSLVWLFMAYREENQEGILIGTISFLLSTITVYIQFAWDAMNKSLFFLIGGLLLFVISYILERKRRKLERNTEGRGIE